jgi:hypothetical protein
MTTQRSFRLSLAVLLATFLSAGAALARTPVDDGGTTSGKPSLVLRVNPAIGVPGGIVAMVLRTYAPRPIKQGQVVVRVVARPAPAAVAQAGRRRAPAGGSGLTLKSLTQPVRPLTLLSTVVYSPLGDAVAKGVLNGLPDSQVAQVNFQSASSTINSVDGPMAVFRFRLDPSASPGDVFDLSLDLTQTKLTDDAGRPITITPRSNTLTVRAPADPFQVAVEGASVQPGGTAELGVSTFEPFAVSGGRFTLTWDPRLSGGAPTVKIDARYGQSVYTVDTSQPGRMVVEFQSSDSSFNSVPGTIVAISMPVAGDAAVGATSPFALDPAGTWLLDPQGNPIGLALEDGIINIQ